MTTTTRRYFHAVNRDFCTVFKSLSGVAVMSLVQRRILIPKRMTLYFCDRDSIIVRGSCHKYHFCHDKGFVATNTSFEHENVCLPRQNFCRNKIMFVATKYFCQVKIFLSRQKTSYLWQLPPIIRHDTWEQFNSHLGYILCDLTP